MSHSHKKGRAQRSAAKARTQPSTAAPASPADHRRRGASADRKQGRREAAIRKQKQQQQLRLMAGVVALAVIIAVALILVNRPGSTSGSVNYAGIEVAQAPIALSGATPQADGPDRFVGTTVGNPNAPVTFVIYSDFQCHFCQQFATETYPQIVEDFVRSGQVKVEFREFPVLGGTHYADTDNGSGRSAHAAMCASEQGEYLEYHEVLFANFSADGGSYTPGNLQRFADEVGLDRGQFDECMESNRYIPALEQSKAEGEALGINATPMFVIDNGNDAPTVTQMTTSGYDLLKKQIETAIESVP